MFDCLHHLPLLPGNKILALRVLLVATELLLLHEAVCIGFWTQIKIPCTKAKKL